MHVIRTVQFGKPTPLQTTHHCIVAFSHYTTPYFLNFNPISNPTGFLKNPSLVSI